MSADPDPEEPTPLELDVAPTMLGRVARGAERVRVLRSQIEAARACHASVDIAVRAIERDSTIGGGMLGGALAYRLFVFLLPRRGTGWRALVPGAALVAVGMLVINAFNVYITSRLVEERADTYGALGMAAALLFSLFLVGRLVVGSAVLNATIEARSQERDR